MKQNELWCEGGEDGFVQQMIAKVIFISSNVCGLLPDLNSPILKELIRH